MFDPDLALALDTGALVFRDDETSAMKFCALAAREYSAEEFDPE